MSLDKPTVAKQREKEAFDNLQAKLRLLEAALAARAQPLRGVSEVLPLAMPRTVRQFNLWEGAAAQEASSEVSVFHRNSHETLRRYPLVLSAVIAAINALKLSELTAEAKSPETRERQVKKRLADSERLRQILEKSVIELQRRNIETEAKNASLLAKMEHLKTRFEARELRAQHSGGRVEPMRQYLEPNRDE